MKILGLAAHRPEKISVPIEATDADLTMLDVSDQDNIIIKYMDLFLSGARVAASDDPPDVIITKGANIIGLIGCLIGTLFRIPVIPRIAGDILTLHREDCIENYQDRNIARLGKSILRYLLDWPVFWAADGLIVVSEYLEEELRLYRTLRHKEIEIVPVHVTPPTRESRRPPTITPDIESPTTLLTVTNLNYRGKYSGIKSILPVIYEVLEDRNETIYVIAGGGRYLPKLERYINHTAPEMVNERIYTVGYVNDIYPVYNAADLFLYFSFEDAYPNVIIEALTVGLPIIANPEVGIDEQLKHEQTGFLISSNNNTYMKQILHSFFNNREKFHKVGHNGREMVLKRNHPENIGRQMIKALELLTEQDRTLTEQ